MKILGAILIAFGAMISFVFCASPVSRNRTIYDSFTTWLMFGLFPLVLGTFFCFVGGRKTRPKCAEKIKANALKCRYCGTDFPSDPAHASD